MDRSFRLARQTAIDRRAAAILAFGLPVALALLIACSEPIDVATALAEAQRLARQDRLEEAEEILRLAAAQEPENAVAQLDLATVRMNAGKFDTAIEGLREAALHLPGDPGIARALGQCLVETGEDEEAIDWLSQALDLAPDPQAYFSRAQAHERQARLEQAEADYRAAIASDPGEPGPHYRLGRLLAAQERAEEAARLERRFEELQRLEGEARAITDRLGAGAQDTQLWRKLAEVRYQQRRPDAAVEALSRAWSLDPSDRDVLRSLGTLLETLGRQAEAQQLYAKAVARDPADCDSWLLLADIDYSRGHLFEAEAAYREALRCKPDLAAALNNLAWLLVEEQRDLAAAAELAGRAVELEANPHFLDTLAMAALATGDETAARQAIDRARELAPNDPQVLARWQQIRRLTGE